MLETLGGNAEEGRDAKDKRGETLRFSLWAWTIPLFIFYFW